MLTAQVLRVANSAYYGMTRNVRTVEEATLRLGFSEVWSIASALKGRDAFKSTPQTATLGIQLWDHSLKTATLSRAMAQRRTAHLYQSQLLIRQQYVTQVL